MTVSLFCLVLVPTIPGLADAEAADGFVSLFNGRDLTGWKNVAANSPSFEVRDGLIECTGQANYPTWLRTEKTYENFILRFDFKPSRWAEAGLLIHAPLHGRCSHVGIGIRLGVDCDPPSHQYCGAVIDGPGAKAAATNDHNEWNTAEVRMDYPVLRVKINGQSVQDLDRSKNEAFRYRLRRGYVGFQDMGYRFAFRNIRIRELPDQETPWKPLFNGKNFDGWRTEGDATWKVRNGAIWTTGYGYLATNEEFEDFELFTYVRTTRHANGGIFYRWKSLVPRNRGQEIQIYNMPDGRNPTGSIYGKARAKRLTVRDGEWFPMHVIVKGKTTVSRVNGETVALHDGPALVRPGSITLQAHRDNVTIEFKDIRIKPLCSESK